MITIRDINGSIIFDMYVYKATVLLLQFQENNFCKRNRHYDITSVVITNLSNSE